MSIEHETGHITSTFQNYSTENTLLEELGDETLIIISNTVHSKISPLLNSSGRINIFAATIV